MIEKGKLLRVYPVFLKRRNHTLTIKRMLTWLKFKLLTCLSKSISIWLTMKMRSNFLTRLKSAISYQRNHFNQCRKLALIMYLAISKDQQSFKHCPKCSRSSQLQLPKSQLLQIMRQRDHSQEAILILVLPTICK